MSEIQIASRGRFGFHFGTIVVAYFVAGIQLMRSGAELGEKLFEEVKLLLNDTDTIRSVTTVKLA